MGPLAGFVRWNLKDCGAPRSPNYSSQRTARHCWPWKAIPWHDEKLICRDHYETSCVTRGVSDARVLIDPEGLFYIARTLAYLGDMPRARCEFSRAVEGGFFCVPAFLRDPWLDQLRANQDFISLLRRAEARHREAVSAFLNAGGDRILGIDADYNLSAPAPGLCQRSASTLLIALVADVRCRGVWNPRRRSGCRCPVSRVPRLLSRSAPLSGAEPGQAGEAPLWPTLTLRNPCTQAGPPAGFVCRKI